MLHYRPIPVMSRRSWCRAACGEVVGACDVVPDITAVECEACKQEYDSPTNRQFRDLLKSAGGA